MRVFTSRCLLIVLNGIEIEKEIDKRLDRLTFNRTKWN